MKGKKGIVSRKPKAVRKEGPSNTAAGGDAIEPSPVDGGSKMLKEIGDLVDTRKRVAQDSDEEDHENENEERQDAVTTAAHPDWTTSQSRLAFVGHNRYSVTAVALSDSHVVFGDKKGVVSTYGIKSQRKRFLEPVHDGAVLSVAVSDVSQAEAQIGLERSTIDVNACCYIASGGADRVIRIWEREEMRYVGELRGHQGSVTGLRFRQKTNTLYSCSSDGVIRSWSIAESQAMEKLYGHKGPVWCIDALSRERCVSGGQDRIPRFWKVDQGTTTDYGQQVTQVESIAMIDESMFVSGSNNGTIAVFSVTRRSAIVEKQLAHGRQSGGDGTGLERQTKPSNSTESSQLNPLLGNAILSLAVAPASAAGNITIMSGSCDGVVRAWNENLEQQKTILVPGFVNALNFSPSYSMLAAATAKEPRLGRWTTMSEVLNGVVLVTAFSKKKAVPQVYEPTEEVLDEEFATKRPRRNTSLGLMAKHPQESSRKKVRR